MSLTKKIMVGATIAAALTLNGRYQEITDRDIPVVILRSIEEDKSGPND